MNKLSILVAAYNEDAFVERCLENVVNEQLNNWEKEIIVINDGSTDNTQNIIENFKKNIHSIKIISLSKNTGKGNAIKKAMEIATGNILLIQDADLEYDPSDFKPILKKFENKETQVVYGSRILGEKFYTNRTSSVIFYLGGKLLSAFVNLLFNTKITDQATCYKAWRSNFSKDLIKNCPSNGFEFEIEMTAFFAKNKLKIEEVPIHYYPRTISFGKKINVKDFVKSVFIGFKCYFLNK